MLLSFFVNQPSQRGGGGVTPLPPADYVVLNDADFNTAQTAATSGQIIELGDTGSFTNLTVTKQNITIRGKSLAGHTIQSIIFNGCSGTTIDGIHVQPTTLASVSDTALRNLANNPRLVSLQGNLSGFTLRNSWIRGGNPWNSMLDFDPTVTDLTRMGGLGADSTYLDNVGTAYNPYQADLWIGIGRSGAITGSIVIENNLVTDCCEGIKFGYAGSGSVTIRNNKVYRCYQDFIVVGMEAGTAAVDYIKVVGNEVADGFSQPQDHGNPHSDFFQFYGQDGASQYLYKIPLMLIGNVTYMRPGCRGSCQRLFASDVYIGYPFYAPTVYGNLMLSRWSGKGVTLNAPDSGVSGAVWAMVEKNILLANLAYNGPLQNNNNGAPAGAANDANPDRINIDIKADETFSAGAVNYSNNNITEGVLPDASLLSNDIYVGGPFTVVDGYSGYFDPRGGLTWTQAWETSSVDDWIAQVNSIKTAYASANPIPAGVTTSAAYRSYWANESNWGQMPSRVGWRNKTGITPSTLTTTEWSYVHAGFQTRSLYGTNCEYRTADDHLGTNATAWASIPTVGSPGSIAHGRFMQLRLTSSATSLGSVTATVVIGSDTASWQVQTADAATYPIVAMDSATPDLFRRASGSLGADSNVGTIALTRFKMASPPAAVQTIFGASSGTARIQVQVVGTTGKLRINLYNGTSQLWRIESNMNVCDGNYHDILASFDTSQTVESAGRSLFVDGLSDSNSAATWGTGGQVVSYSASINAYQFGPATGNNIEIGAFYLNIAARVDLTDATNRAKFSPSAIGTNGTGPTGAQPVIFLVGNDTQWNAGLNRGSGGVHNPVGSSAVTLVSGSAWT
jgi:hypothetical protein